MPVQPRMADQHRRESNPKVPEGQKPKCRCSHGWLISTGVRQG